MIISIKYAQRKIEYYKRNLFLSYDGRTKNELDR